MNMNFMRYRTMIAVTLSAAFLFPVCGCSGQGKLIPQPKREILSYYNKSVLLSKGDSLKIDCDSGTIEVYAWDRHDAGIKADLRIRGTMDEGRMRAELGKYKLGFVRKGRNVTFTSRYKGRIIARNADRNSDFRIYIPRYCRSLSISIDSGKIHIMDDISGKLSMGMNLADATVKCMHGVLDIKAGTGNVVVESGKLSGNTSITAGIGNISLKAAFDKDGNYEFRTGLGSIDIRVPAGTDIKAICSGEVAANDFAAGERSVNMHAASDMGRISIVKY